MQTKFTFGYNLIIWQNFVFLQELTEVAVMCFMEGGGVVISTAAPLPDDVASIGSMTLTAAMETRRITND